MLALAINQFVLTSNVVHAKPDVLKTDKNIKIIIPYFSTQHIPRYPAGTISKNVLSIVQLCLAIAYGIVKL